MKLLNFANSSIDISDGLLTDLEKMINNQKVSYKINENKINNPLIPPRIAI